MQILPYLFQQKENEVILKNERNAAYNVTPANFVISKFYEILTSL